MVINDETHVEKPHGSRIVKNSGKAIGQAAVRHSEER
jgi:hypothetical protein